MNKIKPTELVELEYNYGIFPAKLRVLYKKKANLKELYEASISRFPILLQMEKPEDNYLAMVYHNDLDAEIFLFIADNISYSTIAHECVHIVSNIFKIIGSPITEDTEETFAYLLDHTFEKVADFCTNELKIKVPVKYKKQ